MYKTGSERQSSLPRVTQPVIGGVRTLGRCSPELLSGALGELLRAALSQPVSEKSQIVPIAPGPLNTCPSVSQRVPSEMGLVDKRSECARTLVCALGEVPAPEGLKPRLALEVSFQGPGEDLKSVNSVLSLSLEAGMGLVTS